MAKTVQSFFNDYAAALLSLSAEAISGFYKTPMAVYSDQGVQAISKQEEVLAFWKKGIKPYATQKIAKAVPKVLTEEHTSDTLVVCKVLWEN